MATQRGISYAPFTATSSSLANGASITVTHDADTGYLRQCSARSTTGPGADGCVLLLNADGSDGSTTFTDESYYAHAVTANGNVQIDTAQSKFGGSSGLFDGTSDYLSFSGTLSEFSFGTGDFTIGLWVRHASVLGDQAYFDFRPGSNGAYPCLYLSGGSIRYFVSGSEVIVGGAPTANNWHHLLIARSGTSSKLFVDGTQVGSTYSDSANYSVGSGMPRIGYLSNNAFSLNGHIDSLIMQKGVARHTANFTAPTAAYSADAVAVGAIQCGQSGINGMVTEFLSSTTTRFTNNTGATLTNVVAQVYNCQGV